MLTEDNFKTYVGFQECKGSPAQVFMFEYTQPTPESWVDDIRKMTNDDILERLGNDNQPFGVSFNITGRVVTCTMTLEQVLDLANQHLREFPEFLIVDAFSEQRAKNAIARKTRRGMGNQTLDDIVLYKGGSNELDCCLVIAKFDDLYGLVKHPKFLDYGFILIDDRTKV